MKNITPKKPIKKDTKKEKSGFAWPPRKQIVFFVLLGLLTISIIILKCKKAHHAGMVYDESMTCLHFGSDISKALNPKTIENQVVPITNNHVLNSIFIYYAQKFFSFYEHYIRIPSLAAGVWFTLMLAYIIFRVIKSHYFRLASFAMISLVPFVFNYSFMARGYAFALAALFTQIALGVWLLSRKIRFRYWLVPAILIAALNFLAFGAMLSSLFYLAAFNLVFVCFYSWRIFRPPPEKLWILTLWLGLTILVVSFSAVFLLYHNIYTNLAGDVGFTDISGRWDGWSSFVDLLNLLLVTHVFVPRTLAGKIILIGMTALTIISLAFHAWRCGATIKQSSLRKYFHQDDRIGLIFLVTIFTIIFLFIYGVVVQRSLGLDRNNVFLIPLVLLCLSIMFDRWISALSHTWLRRSSHLAVTIVLIAVLLHNLPSFHYISGASISGPLLRKLNKIDPQITWNIGFNQQTRLYPMAFLYYRQFGYKFKVIGEITEPQITVLPLSFWTPQYFYLDYDDFKRTNCAVVMNSSFPFDRVLLEVKLPDDR